MPLQPPNILQMVADAQTRKLVANTDGRPLGLSWFFELRFDDANAWCRDPERFDVLLERVAALPWFPDLGVLGVDHEEGQAFEGIDQLREILTGSQRVTATLVCGAPRAALWINEAELALSLLVAAGRLEIKMLFAEQALRRHRATAIDAMLELITGAFAAWRSQAQLRSGLAFPDPGSVVYRRVRPPRTASRGIDALVDVIDPRASAQSRTLAEASLPSGVQRREQAGLVIARWVDDPSDRAAVAEACSRHEQWIVPLIETGIVAGWNAAGDLQVPLFSHDAKPEPLTIFDASRSAGYLFVEVDERGGVDDARWKAAAQIARTKALPSRRKLTEVSVVAQDRQAALRIADRAQADGFSKVLYRTGQDELWDPFPPGLWIDQ